MIRKGPSGQRVTLRDAAQLKAGSHARDDTGGVGGIGVSIRAVDWIAVQGPAENRRMLEAAGLFAVGRTCASAIDRQQIILQLRAQANWIDMVMILPVAGLMSVAGVEGIALTEVSVTKPNAVAGTTAAGGLCA